MTVGRCPMCGDMVSEQCGAFGCPGPRINGGYGPGERRELRRALLKMVMHDIRAWRRLPEDHPWKVRVREHIATALAVNTALLTNRHATE